MKPSWLSLILSLTFFLFIFSCNKDHEQSNGGGSINADSSIVSFGALQKQDSIVITSTEPWKIEKPVNATWLRFSRDSGIAGTITVYILAQENPESFSRTATCSIISKGKKLPPFQFKVQQRHEVQVDFFWNQTDTGGAVVNVFGRGFSAMATENKVLFNGVFAEVISATNMAMKVKVPKGAGTGRIIVAVGENADTSDFDFTYDWVGEATVVAGSDRGWKDGVGTNAQFDGPMGLDFDNSGNLFIADFGNYAIRKMSVDGSISTLPGRTKSPYSDKPSTIFMLPRAVKVDPFGNLIVAEYESMAISKITPAGEVRLVAGGNRIGYVDAVGAEAYFYYPMDVALDAVGNIYVADRDNLIVRKINAANQVTTFAGGIWGDSDGIGTAALFNRPYAIESDKEGNLYVCDYFNNKIRKISPAGVVTTFAGTGRHGRTGGNRLTDAKFDGPHSIAIAPDGTIFVSESYNSNAIRMIKPNGMVETIKPFYDSKTGNKLDLRLILGLTINKDGELYFSDTSGNKVYKVKYR